MSIVVALVPVGLAVTVWYALYRVNVKRGWLRTGELIFWDAVILVVIYLVWLRWY